MKSLPLFWKQWALVFVILIALAIIVYLASALINPDRIERNIGSVNLTAKAATLT